MEVTRRLPFLTNFGQRRPSQLAPSRIRVRAALTGRSRALEGKTTDESTPGGIFEARDQAVVAGDPFIDAPPAHRPGAHALGRGCRALMVSVEWARAIGRAANVGYFTAAR